MADRDIGEMLLNFMLSEEFRAFYGVDINYVSTEEEWESHRSGVWERCKWKIMVLTESPYCACQHRCYLPGNYPIFTVVMAIYTYVRRIMHYYLTPNFSNYIIYISIKTQLLAQFRALPDPDDEGHGVGSGGGKKGRRPASGS